MLYCVARRLEDVVLAAQLEVHQGLADAKALGLGVVEGVLDLLGVDDAPLDQQLAEALILCHSKHSKDAAYRVSQR